jgi:hypothetical protein
MAKLNAQQLADKWSRRLTAAGPDIQAGVDRTTKDPGALAAAAKPLWVAKMADPATATTWATNVAKVGAASWKDAMKNKGIPRLQTGVARAVQTKIGRWTSLLSAVDAAVADANVHPRGDINANLARANTFAMSMHNRAPKKTGG